MRILVAPDSFKGTISAVDAAEAIARGVRRAHPDAEIDVCPLADGGEGTLEVVARAVMGERWTARHGDVVGVERDVDVVRWRKAGTGWSTMIESAQLIGLPLVPRERRNPLELSSGPLADAISGLRLDDEATLIIGLGGSATVDGGAGAAGIAGWHFEMPPPTGVRAGIATEHLFERGFERSADLRSAIRLSRREVATARGFVREQQGCSVVALCDVDNPLLGHEGAARVYGPQKGATPEQVEVLEEGLGRLVRLCEKAGLNPKPEDPGAGAAGGLGFGLATFLGANLVRGSAWVCAMVRFDERVRRADLVLTGEGRLDGQSARGKVVAEVARRAGAVPVIAIAGSVDPSVDPTSIGLVGAVGLDAVAGSAEAAMREPARWLEQSAALAVR